MNALEQLIGAFGFMLTSLQIRTNSYLSYYEVCDFHRAGDLVGLIKHLRTIATDEGVQFDPMPVLETDNQRQRFSTYIAGHLESFRNSYTPRTSLGLAEAKTWADAMFAACAAIKDN